MSTATRKPKTVEVELPAEAFDFHPWDPTAIAEQLRILWLVEQVRERRLGHGKAAELAGVPRADFLRAMGRYQVSPFDYDDEELDYELR